MTRISNLEHRFVKSTPKDLENGVLYVSLEYSTMIHQCACGCGRKVVTPLSPRDWKLTYDGKTISVHPSIGSWSLPCRSHYVIRNGSIRWAGNWTDEQIMHGRKQDLQMKRPDLTIQPSPQVHNQDKPAPILKSERQSFVQRIFSRWFGR